MNQECFKSNLGFLSKYLKYDVSADQVIIYWDLLKHLSDDKFELACRNIVKEFIPTSTVPFPLVAHILRYCGDAGDNQVIIAISVFKKAIRSIGAYESVDFNDPALHYAAVANGGWVTMCSWTQDEWNINEKRFMETYRAAIQTGREDKEHLRGISEKQNGFYRIYSIVENGKKLISKRMTPGEIEAQNMQDKNLSVFLRSNKNFSCTI